MRHLRRISRVLGLLTIGLAVGAPAGPLQAWSDPAVRGGLVYGSFLGGSVGDQAVDVIVAAEGSIYVLGATSSADFPTTPGAFDQTYAGNDDVFVSRFDPTGSTLIWSTFVGGSEYDVPEAFAVDASGAVYLGGRTSSEDFPTTPGSFDPTFDGNNSGFVSKLDPTGSSLVYSTFLSEGAPIADLALAGGRVAVTGETDQPDFPTTPSAFDRVLNDGGAGYTDAYVSVFTPSGSALEYSTYLGGQFNDYGYGIATGLMGSAYVTGETQSSSFPTTPGAFDEACGGSDAFATRMNRTGNALVFSTCLGGGSVDGGSDIAVDGSGVYVAGDTSSPDYPTTPGAYDTTINSTILRDVFVTKLDPTGSSLVYSTFLGGANGDDNPHLALEPDGTVTLAGSTYSGNFPTTPRAYDRTRSGAVDDFVSRFDPTGSRLTYSSFFGTQDNASGATLARVGAGIVALAGVTTSASFPVTPDGYDLTFNGPSDAFLIGLRVAAQSLGRGPRSGRLGNAEARPPDR